MPEVPNQKIVDRYKELLALRTHDVIIRDAAIEILEQEQATQKERIAKLQQDHQLATDALGRANETIRLLQNKINDREDPPVIQGEVVE